MKNLKEISKLITKQKIRKIEIFDEKYLENADGKFHQLFEGLQNNRFRNDREAAKYLYNGTPNEPKYRQLKSRFRRRLLNTLFFIDSSKKVVSNYERANAACNKDWALVNILLAYHADGPAYQLAKQTLTTAKNYQITEIILGCARILKNEAALKGDINSFNEYERLFSQYTQIQKSEARSEELYQRVLINYLKQTAEAIDIEAFCQELLMLDEQYESAIISYNMYLVWMLRFEMAENYLQMLEVCERAEKELEQKTEFVIREKQIIFHTKKMLAHLHLQDYFNGKKNAETCLNSYRKGSVIWFKFMEFYLLLALHTDQYIQAVAIFNQAYYHTSFKKLSHQERDKWFLYEAYLHYLIHYLKSDQAILRQQQKKRFPINPFLKKIPDFSKEERIFEVLTLILQILLYIENKKYTTAIMLINQLKNMANRQLKQEGYLRTIQFIRLLRQLERANFNVEELNNIQKFLDALGEQPFAYRGIIKDLEIIRYEKLWEMLIGRLRK